MNPIASPLRSGLVRALAVLLMALPAPLLAAQTEASKLPVPANLPPVLAAMAKSGKIEILRQFDTDVPGLTGYAVRHEGQAEIVFGEHGNLFVGHLISAKGEDLTRAYGKRYLPKPDYAAAVKQLDAHGHLITEGSPKAPVLYAFIDPDCIFCYHLYQQTRAPVAAGKLQMRWVIVGFLKASSAGRAAAILQAKDPLQALKINESKFDVHHEEGGLPSATDPDPKIQSLIKARYILMRSLGGEGTPTLLYETADSKWAATVGIQSQAWMTALEAGKAKSPAE